MFVNKNYTFRQILRFSGIHFVVLLLWSASVVAAFQFGDLELLAIPWLPMSIMGTAVAFYLGFKNNSAYDRLWEARKIWGAIVNSSRSLGSSTGGFITNQFRDEPVSEDELVTIRRTLLHRHIAWLYQLREQLLAPTPWEHVSQRNLHGKRGKHRIERFGIGRLSEIEHDERLAALVSGDEADSLATYKNGATHLIDMQAQQLKNLRQQNLIDDFRHMELQKLLNNFYTQQGKCERIKKFPLPRQYGGVSVVFVAIFIFLLPFSLLSSFQSLGSWGIWLLVPMNALVSWIYLMMEMVGDYSENPFEGMGNDIPMLSLCRTIEIDLRQMLGETELPPPIEATDGVLL